MRVLVALLSAAIMVLSAGVLRPASAARSSCTALAIEVTHNGEPVFEDCVVE